MEITSYKTVYQLGVSLLHPPQQTASLKDDFCVLLIQPHISATCWYQTGAREAPIICWRTLVPLIQVRDGDLSPLGSVREFCSLRTQMYRWKLPPSRCSCTIPSGSPPSYVMVRVTGCLLVLSKKELEFLDFLLCFWWGIHEEFWPHQRATLWEAGLGGLNEQLKGLNLSSLWSKAHTTMALHDHSEIQDTALGKIKHFYHII